MKFYRKIGLVYILAALSVTALVIFGLLYMEKSREQVKYIDAVEHTYKVLSAIELCEKNLLNLEAAQRGFLLTQEDHFKEAFEAGLPSVDSSLRVIDELTADNPSQKVYFFQLSRYVRARVHTLKQNLGLKLTDSLLITNLRNGVALMDYSRYYMAKMRSAEESTLKEKLNTKNKYQRLNLTFFKATFITSCLICVVAIAFFFSELAKRKRMQQKLKAKINELNNSKHELEAITFAASHDLQEPMRKIRILANLITKKFADKISVEYLDDIHRVNKITEQMQGRLNDLVLYTNLLSPIEQHTNVNLYDLFKHAYETIFKDQYVQFRIAGNLPVIYGNKMQLENMLIQLLDNCLKFKVPDRELIIMVTYELKNVKGSEYFWGYLRSEQYHQVTITDNGIGFDKDYNEKIFGLFQRLHANSEYAGRGIGLAIARRVMSNHKGYISANGEENIGASFVLYFPAI